MPSCRVCSRYSNSCSMTSIIVGHFSSSACSGFSWFSDLALLRSELRHCRRWWVRSIFFEKFLIGSIGLLHRASSLSSYSWQSCRRLPSLLGGSREVQGIWFLLQKLWGNNLKILLRQKKTATELHTLTFSLSLLLHSYKGNNLLSK